MTCFFIECNISFGICKLISLIQSRYSLLPGKLMCKCIGLPKKILKDVLRGQLQGNTAMLAARQESVANAASEHSPRSPRVC